MGINNFAKEIINDEGWTFHRYLPPFDDGMTYIENKEIVSKAIFEEYIKTNLLSDGTIWNVIRNSDQEIIFMDCFENFQNFLVSYHLHIKNINLKKRELNIFGEQIQITSFELDSKMSEFIYQRPESKKYSYQEIGEQGILKKEKEVLVFNSKNLFFIPDFNEEILEKQSLFWFGLGAKKIPTLYDFTSTYFKGLNFIEQFDNYRALDFLDYYLKVRIKTTYDYINHFFKVYCFLVYKISLRYEKFDFIILQNKEYGFYYPRLKVNDQVINPEYVIGDYLDNIQKNIEDRGLFEIYQEAIKVL